VEVTWKKIQMRSFKEIQENDLDTFINPNEFGEKVVINSLSINAVIGRFNSKNPNNRYSKGEFSERSYNKNLITAKIKKSDYTLLDSPEIGEYITLNDKSFKIEELFESNGLIKLELEAYGSGNYYD
jgi:hypothetical protein